MQRADSCRASALEAWSAGSLWKSAALTRMGLRARQRSLRTRLRRRRARSLSPCASVSRCAAKPQVDCCILRVSLCLNKEACTGRRAGTGEIRRRPLQAIPEAWCPTALPAMRAESLRVFSKKKGPRASECVCRQQPQRTLMCHGYCASRDRALSSYMFRVASLPRCFSQRVCWMSSMFPGRAARAGVRVFVRSKRRPADSHLLS